MMCSRGEIFGVCHNCWGRFSADISMEPVAQSLGSA